MKKFAKLLIVVFMLSISVLAFSSCESALSDLFNPGNSGDPGTDECDHIWGEWEVMNESSCYNVGQLVRECETCKTIDCKDIPQLEHQYQGYSCIYCGSDMGDWFAFEYLPETDSYLLKTAFHYLLPDNTAKLEVPDYYKGKPVTAIGENAFMNCSQVTEIIIPDSITSIGDGAFAYCIGLTKIVIPNGITSIGENMFETCTSLSEVGIPDTVTSIDRYAFINCLSLTEIHIPDSVTYIAEGAFGGSGMVRCVIPNSVTYIGSGAFAGCEKLASVVISDNVTTILEGTFGGCLKLKSIVIPESVTRIERQAFEQCLELKTVIIGDGVTFIGDNAFIQCDCLSVVVIGKNVAVISDGVFGRHEEQVTRYFYRGTEEQWNNIAIGKYSEPLLESQRYYYSETKPTTLGNFWHWGENGEVEVWE